MHLLVFPKGLNLCFPSCIENELPNRVSHIVPIGFLILVPFLFVVHAILVVAVSQGVVLAIVILSCSE